jgi:hypothetical protein
MSMAWQRALTPAPGALRHIEAAPLAITRVDDGEACVGAITRAGEWIRPGPISPQDVVDRARSPFQHLQWLRLAVRPATSADRRPEDHAVCAPVEIAGPPASGEARRKLLERAVDPSIDAAFCGERSLGLVRARVERIYVKRSTGGRAFIRAAFEDAAGSAFDWIVPDLVLSTALGAGIREGAIAPVMDAFLAEVLADSAAYLAVGLTKPNHRFPGRFRGCHPLIVGLHLVPDRLAAIRELGTAL